MTVLLQASKHFKDDAHEITNGREGGFDDWRLQWYQDRWYLSKPTSWKKLSTRCHQEKRVFLWISSFWTQSRKEFLWQVIFDRPSRMEIKRGKSTILQKKVRDPCVQGVTITDVQSRWFVYGQSVIFNYEWFGFRQSKGSDRPWKQQNHQAWIRSESEIIQDSDLTFWRVHRMINKIREMLRNSGRKTREAGNFPRPGLKVSALLRNFP